MTTVATLTTVKPTTALRVFYFSAGAACAAGGYLGMSRVIWASARASAGELGGAAAKRPGGGERATEEEPLLGPKARGALGARWNGLVDSTLGELARALGRRGI